MKTIEQFDVFELTVPGTDLLTADFTINGRTLHVRGFQLNANECAVRFMPDETGEWQFAVTCCAQTHIGSFLCTPASGSNHGPVKTDRKTFVYADGTPFIPIGTTCYAWIHQPADLISQTLATLADVPFNKVRMLLFPKSMPFNNNEPEQIGRAHV